MWISLFPLNLHPKELFRRARDQLGDTALEQVVVDSTYGDHGEGSEEECRSGFGRVMQRGIIVGAVVW